MSDGARPSRAKFLFIVALFALPIVASYLAYFVWRPAGAVRNYGVLLAPQTLPETLRLTQVLGGDALPLSTLRGKWLLVQVDPASCGTACERKLYAMRQVRLMQGRDQTRLERLWIVSDGKTPAPALQENYAGTLLLADKTQVLLPTLAQASAPGSTSQADAGAQQGIYLIDPLGNLILRWPAAPDIKRMHKDMERLLRASQIG